MGMAPAASSTGPDQVSGRQCCRTASERQGRCRKGEGYVYAALLVKQPSAVARSDLVADLLASRRTTRLFLCGLLCR